MTPHSIFGETLRDWRRQRRFSQLGLALEANVSQRHVSFLETGRAKPSREMVFQLAGVLDLPLAARNALLNAAGFTSAYAQTPLDNATLKPVRRALDRMLAQHMPLPAILFDRYWNLLDANPAAQALFGVDPAAAPFNVVKLIAGNPTATARYENWPEIAHHMIARLKLEAAVHGNDPKLLELIDLLAADPALGEPAPLAIDDHALICSRLKSGDHVLSLFSTIAVFGTARDITINDLRVELFFPADEGTERALAEISASQPE